jgi:WD40 repeat protein
MPACPPLRLCWIVVLFCLFIPAVLAVDPLWTVAAAPGESLSTVAISHDGSTIIAGGDQLIALSPAGQKLWAGGSGSPIDISHDGEYIVTAQGQIVQLYSRQGVMLWDQSLGYPVTAVSISPDAGVIVAGGGTYVQSWYNSGSGMGKNTTENVQDIKISPVKDQIIVCTAQALRSFNLTYVPNWYDNSVSPSAVAISGDGTGIVASNGNHVRMYHGGGAPLWDRAYSGGNIISLAYSLDGSTIVAGRDDSTVLAIDRDGNLLWTGKAGYWITSVGVSDDGSTIATGSIDNQIHVYNRQGTLLGEATTKNTVKSRSVAVSGDGSVIAVVDSSYVYGFSRDQLTVPSNQSTITPAGENQSGNAAVTPVPLNTTSETTPTSGELPQSSGNEPGPATTTSPAPGFSGILVLAALTVMVLAKKR